MPNWVRTRLTFNGEQSRIDELKAFVKSETKDESGELHTNLFDFNKVVPMPEELNIESGSSGDWGMRYLLLNAKHSFLWTDDDRSFMERMEKQKEENPDRFNNDVELGKKYLNNISKYGHTTWYEWHCSNWGTKWNACEVDWVNDNQVEFETAWSFCFPIVEKLSKLFPDVAIEFSYADEDSGSNTGTGTIKNGEEIDCEYPDTGDNRAYEIYLSLHPEYEDELVYDPDLDTYKWIDQDDCEE
jgi:hypothetical protein